MVDLSEETLPALVAIIAVRTSNAENLRFPGEGQSAQGQSVPKARPKGVADGQQVNIPAPPQRRYYDGGTEKDKHTHCWTCAVAR